MKKVDRSRGGWRGSRGLELVASPPPEGDEKMSALDAGFLFLERPHQSFQIGCVAILDAAPDFERLLEALDTRLAEFPRFRQLPIRAKFDLGWPVWRDDPAYDVRRHVRHLALPRPGDQHKLAHVLETLVTQALPVDRPRWEAHLIEGLEHGRAALLFKVHHSMNDGVSGFHVLETIADAAAASTEPPAAAPVRLEVRAPEEPTKSEPAPERGLAGLLSNALADPERGLPALLSSALADPRGLATRGIRDVAEAAETIATLLEQPPAAMPWNGPLGQGRQIVWRSYPIEEFNSLKLAADGTLNDAVLAVVSGALRTHALENGHPPDHGAVRCIVPTNVRTRGEEHQLGNQVTAMFPRLPVDVVDPVERLHRIRDEMRNLKERKQARATGMILAIAGALPSFTEASLLRAASDLSMVNTLCTNVPGPKRTLHVCGRKIVELHAVAPLFLDVGLAFAATSYVDRVSICAVADPALVPDVEAIGNALDAALYDTRRALWKRSEALAAASRLVRGPTVADLMSRDVATIGVDDSLQHAHEMMRGRRLAHLPVVDRQTRLIGVLTQRDLLFASPEAPAQLNPEDRARMLGRFAVGRAVDARLTTARPDESVLDAGKRMVENQLDFLPVVDDAGQLLGLVTEDHIVRWTSRAQAH